MLAYVFWHWKQTSISASDYEARQRAFHDALAAAPPDGFSRSYSHELSGAPWAADGGEAYEDWYLIRDSAALDPLNDGAISASRAAPHDAAAAAAAGGTAGVYRLRLGTPPRAPVFAYWFSKPDGMSYSEIWAKLTPIVEQAKGALWLRNMVLGPSPEFCIQTLEPVKPPAPIEPRALALRTVWSGRPE